MKAFVIGAACAALVGATSLAQAAQLLSPPYFIKTRGDNFGTKAACVIRNVGTQKVTVDVELVSNNDMTPIFDFCKVNGKPIALAAGATCLVSADLLEGGLGLTAASNRSDTFIACRVTAGNVANLRGTLELADSPSHGFDVYLGIDF